MSQLDIGLFIGTKDKVAPSKWNFGPSYITIMH